MDIGCLNLGCISEDCDARDNVTSATKTGKSKSPRGTGQSTLSALNKFTSQIKKPPHRKNSPLNWFPRKKVDSYLKRKIKMLQEIDGMNLTLDETLCDSNPHYSRVLREKIAAREAANKAMEARKAALVEASWCRILRAARIQSKEAEALLAKAEKTAAEAFEAATALGVIMYDMPNCPQKPCQIETSTANGGRSTTDTVTASFETAFDVDKQVAAAVKNAFIRLATCPSFDKDELKELLCKISQNPEMGDENSQESSEYCSEHESESGSETETSSECSGFSALETRQRKNKRRHYLENLSIVDMMLERLKCLKERELSSLATIVATCGLNATLAEVESSKLHDPDSAADCTSSVHISRRISSVGAGTMKYSNHEQIRNKQVDSELPSLDKFLVKRMSKLEREVQEAKDSRRNRSLEANQEKDKIDNKSVNVDNNTSSRKAVPDLGSFLVKHRSKFEKEIEEAKKNSGKTFEIAHEKPVADLTSLESIPDLGSMLIKHSSKLEKEVQEIKENTGKSVNTDNEEFERAGSRAVSQRKGDAPEVPSLDKFLVKHVLRLEKEVQEAKNRRIEKGRSLNINRKVNSSTSISESEKEKSTCDGDVTEKENVNLNKSGGEPINLNAGKTLSKQNVKAKNNEREDNLDKILVRPVHRLERDKKQALSSKSNHENIKHQNKHGGNAAKDYESLDKILVKHVSRLEKEKMEFSSKEEDVKAKWSSDYESLDKILVKHAAKDYESLDKILVKHVSRLEKEKMEFSSKEEDVKAKTSCRNMHMQMSEGGGLDQVLVKHKLRLEREKMVFSQQAEDQNRVSVSRREGRERELQEAWGGLSLENSIRPHLSKLERDKAAWIKAEEEERRQAIEENV